MVMQPRIPGVGASCRATITATELLNSGLLEEVKYLIEIDKRMRCISSSTNSSKALLGLMLGDYGSDTDRFFLGVPACEFVGIPCIQLTLIISNIVDI